MIINRIKMYRTSVQKALGGVLGPTDPRPGKSWRRLVRCPSQRTPFGIHFRLKMPSKNHQNNDHQKTWSLMPKKSQNGAEIDTKTHQKTMPKLVTKKTMKIIKKHDSLKGEIIKIQCKNKCFWWFRRLRTRTVKVSKKHQKWYQNPSQTRWKIYTSFMLEKGIPKTWKVIKKMIKKGNENHKQIEK